jgi:Domain of unknown function (DUF3850)
MTHDFFLRTPEFEAILERRKRFVTSQSKNPYKVGDKLKLNEFDFRGEECSGRFLIVTALYVDCFQVKDIFNYQLQVVSISEPLGLSGVQN